MANSDATQPNQDDLIRHASHEIKNDLASILALVELLELKLPNSQDEKQRPIRELVERLRKRIHETTADVDTIFKELRQ